MANFTSDDKRHVQVEHLESNEISPDNATKVELDIDFSPAEQRKIIHRIDRRLVVTVGVM